MDGGNTGGGTGSIAPAASVSVVVPTYREVENVPDLVESVGAALSGRGFAWELLLVDDASDDGPRPRSPGWPSVSRFGSKCAATRRGTSRSLCSMASGWLATTGCA